MVENRQIEGWKICRSHIDDRCQIDKQMDKWMDRLIDRRQRIGDRHIKRDNR